jgi:hypothetical protein
VRAVGRQLAEEVGSPGETCRNGPRGSLGCRIPES